MKDEWKDVEEVNAKASEAWDMKEPLIGTFLGTKHDVGPNQSQMHEVKTDDGEKIGAWGSTVLDNKMGEVEVGSRVKITYLDKVTNPKTNRTYKDFSVLAKAPEKIEGEPVIDKVDLAKIPF